MGINVKTIWFSPTFTAVNGSVGKETRRKQSVVPDGTPYGIVAVKGVKAISAVHRPAAAIKVCLGATFANAGNE